MYIKQLIKFMSIAEKLKNNTRHSWTSDGRQESVAEHSWRLSLMAYLVKDEYPDADINKVILMCICHDLGKRLRVIYLPFIKLNQMKPLKVMQ